MNISDTRKHIFSYLRSDAKVTCHHCDKILIWDNKPKVKIFYKSLEKNYIASFCGGCYYKEMGYTNSFYQFILFVGLYFLSLYFFKNLIF